MIFDELNKIEGITIEKGYSSDTMFVITGTDETLKIAATTLENAGFSCDNEMLHSAEKPDVFGTILFSYTEYPGLARYYVLDKDLTLPSAKTNGILASRTTVIITSHLFKDSSFLVDLHKRKAIA